MKRLAILLFAISPNALAGISFDTLKVSEGVFVITLSSDKNIEIEQAQRLIFPEAQKICGDQPIGYGQYRFRSTESISEDAPNPKDKFEFDQNVVCGVDKLGSKSSSKPTLPVDEEKVKADVSKITAEYFNFLEVGDFKSAYSMLSNSMKSYSTPSGWEEQQRDFSRLAGAILKSDFWRVTVYVDPPSTPQKGIYVAVDYDRVYEEVPIHCGYLIWYLNTNGKFELVREETGHVDSKLMAKIKQSDIPNIRAQLRCNSL